MKENNRGGFNSKFGLMMAVVGSAVGLGNIWRFPFLTGQNGGAAFLIIYIGLIFLVGLPLVLSEFIIGKGGGGGPFSSIKKLTKKKNSGWLSIGYLSIVTSFVLLGFYCVVAGWVLRFFVESITSGFSSMESSEVSSFFSNFTAQVWQPIIYGVAFTALCSLIVARGIEKGIEKWNKVLIPCLVFMLVLLGVNSMTLEGWGEGISFLFNPDWSKVTEQTFIDALGQVFFTLSIGMGVMITYSSYVKGDENMFKTKVIASMIDTGVAILAGIAIFPAVFTYGLEVGEGPGLVFVTLPNVFAQMPMGWFISIAFFTMLSIAAVTSAISMMEVLVTTFIEEYNMTRKKAIWSVGAMTAILCAICASSDFMFNSFDIASSKVLMPVCGLLIALYVGYSLTSKKVRKIFTSDGKYSNAIYPILIALIRYIAPLAIAIIILSGLNIL